VPSQTQKVGKQAEEFAADYLQERGFRIIDRNWRCRWGELDLIAREGEQMVFIEVKARSTHDFGSPEESLTRSKKGRLLKTAWQYLETVGKLDSEWRFDLIAIDLNAEGENHFINHYQHVIEDSEH
jgi:putative endonuclease